MYNLQSLIVGMINDWPSMNACQPASPQAAPAPDSALKIGEEAVYPGLQIAQSRSCLYPESPKVGTLSTYLDYMR